MNDQGWSKELTNVPVVSSTDPHSLEKPDAFVLFLLCDGQSSVVTRGDTGEARANKVSDAHRSKRQEVGRATWERHQGGQEPDDKSEGKALGQSLYWGFCGKGKAGQGEQFRIGWFEFFQWALYSYRGGP